MQDLSSYATKKAVRMSPSFVCLPALPLKASWKRLKLGRSHIVHETLGSRGKDLALAVAATFEPLLDFTADFDQNADEMGDVATGVVDVGLQQHRVARGLLTWILKRLASRPLNWVPSKPAVPQTSVMRVGSR